MAGSVPQPGLWRGVRICLVLLLATAQTSGFLRVGRRGEAASGLALRLRETPAVRASARQAMAAGGDNDLSDLKSREKGLLKELRLLQSEKSQLLSEKRLNICIIGFGNFGQFLAKSFAKYHSVTGSSRGDYRREAEKLNCGFVPISDLSRHVKEHGTFDVYLIAVSIPAFAKTLDRLPTAEIFADSLVVDVLSVKEHPREHMLRTLAPGVDLLCTHPMFGPESGKFGWHDLPFVFERTRIGNEVAGQERNGSAGADVGTLTQAKRIDRMETFLSVWEMEGCEMLEMSCAAHDAYAANSQFISHLLGRLLEQQGLVATPIDTNAFKNVLQLVETTCNDSWDLFYGLYKYNQNSANTLLLLRKALVDVEWRLREMDNLDASIPGWKNASLNGSPGAAGEGPSWSESITASVVMPPAANMTTADRS